MFPFTRVPFWVPFFGPTAISEYPKTQLDLTRPTGPLGHGSEPDPQSQPRRSMYAFSAALPGLFGAFLASAFFSVSKWEGNQRIAAVVGSFWLPLKPPKNAHLKPRLQSTKPLTAVSCQHWLMHVCLHCCRLYLSN